MAATPGRRISYVDLNASSWDRANAFLSIAQAEGYNVRYLPLPELSYI